MTNRRGVNDFGMVESLKWKAGLDANVNVLGERMGIKVEQTLSSARRVVPGLAAVFLIMVSLGAAQETGWRADLARMGFEVPIEELEKGEIVGQKWLVGGRGPGFWARRPFLLRRQNRRK
jgi:hypothetical protein